MRLIVGLWVERRLSVDVVGCLAQSLSLCFREAVARVHNLGKTHRKVLILSINSQLKSFEDHHRISAVE